MLRATSAVVVAFVVGVVGCSGGSSSGTTSLACRQKADSDTANDCKSVAGKPRKLDCDNESQTDSALAAGCTRTDPGDSDVCCPLSITGTTASSSSGTTTLACRQKDDADTDSDCAGQSGKPRKLDCDSESQTDAALAAGCVRTGPGDSDVCCPTSLQGTTSTSSSSSNTDGGSSSGTCGTGYGGDWQLTGSCGNTTCSVVQTGCLATVVCENGAKLRGDIEGTSAQLTGTLSESQTLTCTATFKSTTSFSLTCNLCSGTGTKP